MKRAVSISIGSSKRNKCVEIELLGEKVQLERIGTDGDMEKAAQMYRDLDGKVDAFGVGGAVLGLMVERRWYSLPNVQSLVRYVSKTPMVDGTGLKMTLEAMAAQVVDECVPLRPEDRRAFLISGVDRYGLTRCFIDAGYKGVIGDFMFALGLPIPMHTLKSLHQVARILIPIVGRLPFEWLYPTGEAQEKRTPKFKQYFDWAKVVAGDCHYITHCMPDEMDGKIVVTNTTTTEDRELFRSAGVKYLMTTTPMLDGRSFGTNMIEAGLVAAMGRKDPVNYAVPGDYFGQIKAALDTLKLKPQLQEL
jgi:hypothetical protein